MKKIMKMLLLAAIFTLALSVSAFAAGSGTEAGICDVESVSGVTVTPMLENGTTEATENANGVYVNAKRVTVTFSKAVATKYYLVVALDEGEYPTVGDDGENNVAYINQVTASSSSVSFDVYPKSLVSGQTYNVYVSSNDGVNGYTKVASFSYYAPFTPGDVYTDDAQPGEVKININDVMSIINHIVKKEILTGTKLLAAEVTQDNPINVNINDAMEVINYIVGKPQYLTKK